MKLFYSHDYIAMRHAISATRKAAWVAESLMSAPLDGVTLRVPQPVQKEWLERVHAPDYVQAIQTGRPRALAESSTFPWDEGTWISELVIVGGMVEAVNAALQEGVAGSLSAGFHHARHECGSSFCTFNGLAVAAFVAFEFGIERILHIDVDAHCGGGTYSILSTTPGYRQMDVSLFPTDKYEPNPPSTLDLVSTTEDYLPTIRRRLDELQSTVSDYQLCIYFAGMDPHEGSAYGGLPGIDASMLHEREAMVFDWLAANSIPVAFSLGGGYVGPGLDRDGLVSLHRTTIQAAVRCQRLNK